MTNHISQKWNNELVSIIMPAYNAGDFIEDSIQSVISQTYPNWELLITDDLSTDNTNLLVQNWTKKDSRIILITSKVNQGPAGARNMSLSKSRGRWVAFLDSDDTWLSNKLEMQISFHLEKKCKITFTDYRRISRDGTCLGHQIKVPQRINYNKLMKGNVIATSTCLVDRAMVGNFLMPKAYYDDFLCWLKLLQSGGDGFGLNFDLMRYRVVNNSVSHNKLRSAMHTWKVYNEIGHLSMFKKIYYFLNYVVNGLIKYRKF